MEIDISFTSLKWYNLSNLKFWVWYYKPYTNIKGFIFRIFGVYLNVKEDNSLNKLIEIARYKKR